VSQYDHSVFRCARIAKSRPPYPLPTDRMTAFRSASHMKRFPRPYIPRGRKKTPGAAPDFERPFVTVDVVILALRTIRLQCPADERGSGTVSSAWPCRALHPSQRRTPTGDGCPAHPATEGRIERPMSSSFRASAARSAIRAAGSATFAYFSLIAAEGLVLKEGANAEESRLVCDRRPGRGCGTRLRPRRYSRGPQ